MEEGRGSGVYLLFEQTFNQSACFQGPSSSRSVLTLLIPESLGVLKHNLECSCLS